MNVALVVRYNGEYEAYITDMEPGMYLGSNSGVSDSPEFIHVGTNFTEAKRSLTEEIKDRIEAEQLRLDEVKSLRARNVEKQR